MSSFEPRSAAIWPAWSWQTSAAAVGRTASLDRLLQRFLQCAAELSRGQWLAFALGADIRLLVGGLRSGEGDAGRQYRAKDQSWKRSACGFLHFGQYLAGQYK
ncbi:MAG: hypothetical protein R3F40_00230 [Candidatus Competibacteraceae bacterium]